MFEQLADRLDDALGKLRQRGVITEERLDEGLREVRRALLEADVNFRVARSFLERVRERALGEDVLDTVSPGEQVVKIVHDELVALLGEGETGLAEATVPPTTLLLAGLQGSGKTTTAAKLARRLQRDGRRPVLVACDPYRPAAGEQLARLAGEIDVPVIRETEAEDMPELAESARDRARREGATHVILDTAGRLQADPELMDELRRVKERSEPDEVLLVADGMVGQEAVEIAEGFHETVGLTGAVLTKMEGDARGGAALSFHGVLDVPVKFLGTGERLEDLTVFDPRRMAGRILQMGDVVGLVEKAEQAVDEETTRRLEENMLGEGTFDLEDFLAALRQLQNMGPLENLLKMLPGVKQGMLDRVDTDPRRIRHMEAIVLSMTPEERRRPDVLDGSRRKRIARGAGRPVSEVNRLVRQFEEMKEMMGRMKEMKGSKKMKAIMGRGGGMGGLFG